MFLIQQPLMQWDDPLQNKPVQRGKLYIGLVGLDPKVVANRIPVYYYNALGNSVALPQPIELSDSGVPTYLGQPVEPYVDDNCSIRVDDRNGNQVYYIHEYTGTIGNGNYLLKPNNLSDVPDKALARTNLGLGNAAQATVVTSSTDSTAGRLLTVGYQGVGGVNPSGGTTNANTLTSGQRRTWTGTEAALVALNLPALGGSGDRVWHVETAGNDDNNMIMLAQESNSCRRFTRVKTAGTWGAWFEVFTTNREAQLLPKDYAIQLSANALLTANNKYMLTGGTEYILQSGTGLAVGSAITIRRLIGAVPNIVTTGGQQIRIGIGGTQFFATTSYTFNKNTEITFVWNGTAWEGVNMNIGAGGGFNIETATTFQNIPSGVSGVIATITPPAGKRAALLLLASDANPLSQTGISVKVSGSSVVTGTLAPYQSGFAGSGSFSIGPQAAIQLLSGGFDQSITIEAAAATTHSLAIAYAYGE